MPRRKLDLYNDCNAERLVSEKEFNETFCVRCKNPECDRAGHADSAWSARMATQIDRLFGGLRQTATTADSRYESLKGLFFQEVAPAVSLYSGSGNPLPPGIGNLAGDPWAVHMADPEIQVDTSGSVRDAARALSGKSDPEPVPPQNPPPQQNPAPTQTPVAQPRIAGTGNTTFPTDGVMLDGSPPPIVAPVPRRESVDPWAVPTRAPAGGTVVPPGARIKMGR